MSIHEDFKIWWHNEGSGMPPANGEETCDHVERISEIAWHNGAYKANDALIEENARLKEEVAYLKGEEHPYADLGSMMPKYLLEHWVKENARLKAEVERLRKAGDNLITALDKRDDVFDNSDKRQAIADWNAAKEGKQP